MNRQNRADEVLSRLELFGIRLGLETSRRLLGELGDPHLAPTTVLVGGTNGKGSVASLIAAMGTAAGYRTALFTSPHLESVTERLRIDGRAVGIDRLGDLLERTDELAKTTFGQSATYFETLFAAACAWFAEEQVELAVFEVGLGGRLDATNVCEPACSVITGIGLEHQDQLGDSIESIAREKAGILRPGRPAIVGARSAEALAMLRRLAQSVGAEWIRPADQIEIRERHEEIDWSRRLQLRSRRGGYEVHLRLPGEHQEHNLVTSIAVAEALAELGWDGLSGPTVEMGVAQCVWPGRLERVELPGRSDVVLDAAHNPQAARVLADFLSSRLTDYVLVFGVLGDKNAGEMLPLLSRPAAEVFLTRPPSSRSVAPDELVRWSRAQRTITLEAPSEALDEALESGRTVVVCGSIYLVGEIRGCLRGRFGVPEAF